MSRALDASRDGWSSAGAGPDPLEHDLRRLAEDGYSAPAGSLERIERRLVVAFRDRLPEPPAASGSLAAPSRPIAMRRWTRPAILIGLTRRAVAVGVMASLVLGGGAAVASAESLPGRPLFGVRVAFEEALLPASPAAARIQAQLTVLDRRLAEAAEVNEDGDAVSDASRAYRAALSELLPLVRQDPAQSATVEDRVATQLRAIEQLRWRAAPDARRELDAAAEEAVALLATLRSGLLRSQATLDAPTSSPRAGGTMAWQHPDAQLEDRPDDNRAADRPGADRREDGDRRPVGRRR